MAADKSKISEEQRKKIEQEIEQNLRQKELERERRQKEFAVARQGVPSAAGAAFEKIKEYNPGVFAIAFILSIGIYLFDYFRGFTGDWPSLALNCALALIFLFGFGFQWFVIPFTIYVLIPLLNLQGFIPFFSYLLVFPLWLISASAYKVISDPKSKTSKALAFGAILLILFFSFPYLLKAAQSTQLLPNTEAINQAKTSISDAVSNSINSVSQYIAITQCTLTTQKTDAQCRKDLYGTGEVGQFAVASATATTQFTMSISSFTPGGTINTASIPTDISATNNMKNSVKIEFMCGFQEKGKGNPSPAELDVLGGVKRSIICNDLDISGNGIRTFYFNMTAIDLTTHGSRDFIVVGPVENPEEKFSSFISNQDQTALQSTIVGNDIVQPLMLIGYISAESAQSPLIHAMDESSYIDFAIALKNNGAGSIRNIKEINIMLPDDFAFDKPNCGITQDYLKTTKWSSIAPNSISPDIAICRLNLIKPLESPNNPSTRTISIAVTYDYSLDRGQQVKMPERLT